MLFTVAPFPFARPFATPLSSLLPFEVPTGNDKGTRHNPVGFRALENCCAPCLTDAWRGTPSPPTGSDWARVLNALGRAPGDGTMALKLAERTMRPCQTSETFLHGTLPTQNPDTGVASAAISRMASLQGCRLHSHLLPHLTAPIREPPPTVGAIDARNFRAALETDRARCGTTAEVSVACGG